MRADPFWAMLAGLAAAYLIGAIPVGFLVARAAGGLDIRRAGSGSIGATNVLRTIVTKTAAVLCISAPPIRMVDLPGSISLLFRNVAFLERFRKNATV